MKDNIIKFGLAVCFAVGLAFTSKAANAYSQMQVDTNRLTFASTNFYNIATDVNTNPATSLNASTNQTLGQFQVIDCGYSMDTWLQVGGFWTNSTANSSNVTYRVAASVDGANWTNNYTSITLVVPASSTNWCSSGPVRLQGSPPILCLRSVENSNTAVIGAGTNSVYLKAVHKKGI